jgi:hypothetical protein
LLYLMNLQKLTLKIVSIKKLPQSLRLCEIKNIDFAILRWGALVGEKSEATCFIFLP